jgi:hypothetical protein
MANDGDGPSSAGELAERQARKRTALGPVRASLIAKGLVYSGMADFIARNATE